MKIEWYDHELNPLGKWLLKYGGGLPALAWLKALVMLHIAHMVRTIPPVMISYTTWVFVVLTIVYIGVVINNFMVIRKLAAKPRKVRVKKQVDFEDPLLPI